MSVGYMASEGAAQEVIGAVRGDFPVAIQGNSYGDVS